MLRLTSQWIKDHSEVGRNWRSGTIHASHGLLPVTLRPVAERVPATLFVCLAADSDITASFVDDVVVSSRCKNFCFSSLLRWDAGNTS